MLSVAESASLLGVSPARIRALISEGTLPARKVGRAWVLREEDVLHRKASHPAPGRPKRSALPCDSADAASAQPDLHELYLSAKEAFRTRPDTRSIANAESDEKAGFYFAVADYFLQRRQRELVDQGAF